MSYASPYSSILWVTSTISISACVQQMVPDTRRSIEEKSPSRGMRYLVKNIPLLILLLLFLLHTTAIFQATFLCGVCSFDALTGKSGRKIRRLRRRPHVYLSHQALLANDAFSAGIALHGVVQNTRSIILDGWGNRACLFYGRCIFCRYHKGLHLRRSQKDVHLRRSQKGLNHGRSHKGLHLRRSQKGLMLNLHRYRKGLHLRRSLKGLKSPSVSKGFKSPSVSRVFTSPSVPNGFKSPSVSKGFTSPSVSEGFFNLRRYRNCYTLRRPLTG